MMGDRVLTIPGTPFAKARVEPLLPLYQRGNLAMLSRYPATTQIYSRQLNPLNGVSRGARPADKPSNTGVARIMSARRTPAHPRSHITRYRQPTGWFAAILLAGLLGNSTAVASVEPTATEQEQLHSLYREFHQQPEVAFQEHETAARLAHEYRQLGFEVTESVGQTGVVAVYENGPGPTLMIRADMDGLPVEEQTGLPYASEHTQLIDGEEASTMHACGHDVHMTVAVGTAKRLIDLQDEWQGTLVIISQPAEEIGEGALAMLEDGLFERFPRPDATLGFHVNAELPVGQIGFTPEYAYANVDSVDLTVHGVGGHGAYPHTTKDPVVLAANIVSALQTLISRETSPLDSGVVTVGSIRGGSTHNIISDQVHLQLTVRSYTDEHREHLLSGIQRIANGQAKSAGLPEEQWPTISTRENYTPAVYNDPELTAKARASMAKVIGEEQAVEVEPVMAGEDFGRYGRAGVPSSIIWLGVVTPDDYAAAEAGDHTLPSLHSPYFAPDPAAIEVGVAAMTQASLDFFVE